MCLAVGVRSCFQQQPSQQTYTLQWTHVQQVYYPLVRFQTHYKSSPKPLGRPGHTSWSISQTRQSHCYSRTAHGSPSFGINRTLLTQVYACVIRGTCNALIHFCFGIQSKNYRRIDTRTKQPLPVPRTLLYLPAGTCSLEFAFAMPNKKLNENNPCLFQQLLYAFILKFAFGIQSKLTPHRNTNKTALARSNNPSLHLSIVLRARKFSTE
mmetsp:Transcript_23999/g.38402  ORF Transcript_23999/g.38402 Transcript_23999/m.38402 type:complete len:210 (-) Transcript_23999:3553-4182(-)